MPITEHTHTCESCGAVFQVQGTRRACLACYLGHIECSTCALEEIERKERIDPIKREEIVSALFLLAVGLVLVWLMWLGAL